MFPKSHTRVGCYRGRLCGIHTHKTKASVPLAMFLFGAELVTVN